MPETPPFPAGRYGAVIRALEGVRNRHALSVLLVGFLLVGMVIGLGNGLAAWSGSVAVALLLNLAGAVLAASVVNAAGLALMDAARGEPEKPLAVLWISGARCFVSFIAIGLMAALCFTLYLLVAAILLWACKIPVLGPVLLAVFVPVLVLGAALLLLALSVAASMVAPSLWAGNPIRAAVAELVTLVRQRPFEILVSLILLGLLVGVIGSVASLFVFAGSTAIGGLAAGILSAGPLGGFGSLDGNSLPIANPGLAVAGSIGFMLVFALLSGVLGAIQMNGLCHIYLEVRGSASGEGLEAAPTWPRPPRRKRRKPVEPAADPWEELPVTVASPPAAEPPAEPATSAFTCPHCAAAIGADDRFCGECGQPVGAGRP